MLIAGSLHDLVFARHPVRPAGKSLAGPEESLSGSAEPLSASVESLRRALDGEIRARRGAMAEGELSVALTILRVVRGWTQADLAKASESPNSSISDYEREKKVPSLKSLERLTAAMGFSIHSLQRTRRVIVAVRAESLLSDLEPKEWPAESPGFEAVRLDDGVVHG